MSIKFHMSPEMVDEKQTKDWETGTLVSQHFGHFPRFRPSIRGYFVRLMDSYVDGLLQPLPAITSPFELPSC